MVDQSLNSLLSDINEQLRKLAYRIQELVILDYGFVMLEQSSETREQFKITKYLSAKSVSLTQFYSRLLERFQSNKEIIDWLADSSDSCSKSKGLIANRYTILTVLDIFELRRRARQQTMLDILLTVKKSSRSKHILLSSLLRRIFLEALNIVNQLVRYEILTSEQAKIDSFAFTYKQLSNLGLSEYMINSYYWSVLLDYLGWLELQNRREYLSWIKSARINDISENPFTKILVVSGASQKALGLELVSLYKHCEQLNLIELAGYISSPIWSMLASIDFTNILVLPRTNMLLINLLEFCRDSFKLGECLHEKLVQAISDIASLNQLLNKPASIVNFTGLEYQNIASS